MEQITPSVPQKFSYKQVSVKDRGNDLPCAEDQKVDNYTSTSVHQYTDSTSMGNDDDIPDLLASDLKDMTPFYHMYLIGKIFGEAVSIKFIIATCTFEWKVTGEVNFMDMGNGFNLVMFSNEMDCITIFEGQPWFVGVQLFSLQR